MKTGNQNKSMKCSNCWGRNFLKPDSMKMNDTNQKQDDTYRNNSQTS